MSTPTPTQPLTGRLHRGRQVQIPGEPPTSAKVLEEDPLTQIVLVALPDGSAVRLPRNLLEKHPHEL